MAPDIKESTDWAFKMHLADYEDCCKRIDSYFGTHAQLMNLNIGVIAGITTLGALGQNVSTQSPYIFLIGALLMASLCWALANVSIEIAKLFEYIEQTLIPKIQKLIGNDQTFEYIVLDRNRKMRINFLGAGKHVIAYIAGTIFLFLFWYQKQQLGQVVTTLEWIFCFAILLIMLVPPINGSVFLFRRLKEKRETELI